MDEVLYDLGFDVTLVTDRDLHRMQCALDRFVEDAENAQADMALVYFAGHGIEVGGENLVLPIDAVADDAATLKASGLPLADLAASVQKAAPTGLLIIDACRTDAFGGTEGGFSRSEARQPAVSAGLGRVGRAHNLLYAYAAAPGQAAMDGSGDNSPFTGSLLRHFDTEGLEIRSVLTLVRQDLRRLGSDDPRVTELCQLAEYQAALGGAPDGLREAGSGQGDRPGLGRPVGKPPGGPKAVARGNQLAVRRFGTRGPAASPEITGFDGQPEPVRRCAG
ncbi:MAG: hypothetical protein CML68_13260 [Rhodobacteraceae bacterium]|nr:hypothetical protein [Paracoccaceae bacterium]